MSHFFKLVYVFSASCTFTLVFGMHASAATFSVSIAGEHVSVSDEFEVHLTLDASDAAINAVEGTLTFPANLEVKEIRDGNSFVSLWIERPHSTVPGEIRFSGVIPGGYIRTGADVFSVIFTAKKEGTGVVSVQSAQVLLNDGSGTPAVLSVSHENIVVAPMSARPPSRVPRILDREPPESFSLEIAQSPDLFDGNYFAVFATQDKGSGVSSYAVYESKWNVFWVLPFMWETTASPYVLRDQALESFVHIRATDNAGNTRVETIVPPHGTGWSLLYALGVPCVVGLIIYGCILVRKGIKRPARGIRT